MVVSNAESGVPGAGTVSSYSLRHGAVRALTSALPTGEQAPCWVAIGEGGRTAYVSNPDNNSISLVRIGHDGTLSLGAASAGPTNAGPIDLEVHEHLLFSDASATIQVHRIADDGTLSLIADSAIPQYSQGIAVR
jgi:6-phosphogluconolactonase (cycloisomerase 2 family)